MITLDTYLFQILVCYTEGTNPMSGYVHVVAEKICHRPDNGRWISDEFRSQEVVNYVRKSRYPRRVS